MEKKKLIQALKSQIEAGIKHLEYTTGKRFGDPANPLLLSVRSGARASMPGMMDTILNLGMNQETVEGFARLTRNPRAAWDSYRRFVQMYGDVVMGIKAESKQDEAPFEKIVDDLKLERGYELDTEMNEKDLMELGQSL